MGHGSMYHRRPGSMGPTSTPGRVFKGKNFQDIWEELQLQYKT